MDSFKREIEGGEVMLAVMEYDGQRGERFVRTAKTRQRERDALRKRDASLKNWRSKESRSPVRNWPNRTQWYQTLHLVPWAASPVSTTALHM